MSRDYQAPVTDEDRIMAGLAMHQVAVTTGVLTECMTRRGRLTPLASRARRLAIYLCHVGYSWPVERAGDAFGVNRATAGAACRWAEDERERPDIDEMLARCEESIRTLFSAPRCELSALSEPVR